MHAGPQDLAQPLALEGAVQRLLGVYEDLQRGCGTPLVAAAREVLAANALCALPGTAATRRRLQRLDTAHGERLVAFVAEWFARTLILDADDLGISFSMSKCAPVLPSYPLENGLLLRLGK
jgi:hypothetical protein